MNEDTLGYQFLIDFNDAPDSFANYSITKVLSGAIPPLSLKDQVVIIGTVAESVKDFFFCPIRTNQ